MARSTTILFATLGLLALVSPASADDLAPEALLEQRAPAIVSLKFVLKMNGSESATEAHGTVVDPSGLVVLSDGDLGGEGVKAADLKVLFGSDPKEWEAVVVARDKNLALAYVQVLALGDKPVPAVDLAQGAEPRLGLSLFGVRREGRGFDFAPSLEHCYVSSKVEKPRAMWGVSGDFGSAGLPAFDGAGRPVGVLADQESSEGAAEEGEGTTSRTFLIPLADVSRSLAAAKKRVPDAVAKAEAAKKAGADEGAKPAVPAGMDGAGMDGAAMDGAAMGEPAPTPAPDAPKAPESPK